MRFIASPGRSSPFVIGNETFQIESVVYRLTPHVQLTYAEQSMPAVVELPPQMYFSPRSDAARDKMR